MTGKWKRFWDKEPAARATLKASESVSKFFLLKMAFISWMTWSWKRKSQPCISTRSLPQHCKLAQYYIINENMIHKRLFNFPFAFKQFKLWGNPKLSTFGISCAFLFSAGRLQPQWLELSQELGKAQYGSTSANDVFWSKKMSSAPLPRLHVAAKRQFGCKSCTIVFIQWSRTRLDVLATCQAKKATGQSIPMALEGASLGPCRLIPSGSAVSSG